MSFLKNIANGLSRRHAPMSHAERMDLIAHYQRKTDAELSSMNMKRETIAALVMRGVVSHKV